jgi:kynureninase
MRTAKVVGDYRAPDQVRVACSPLATRYVEVWDGFARIRDLLASGGYLRAAPPLSRVT